MVVGGCAGHHHAHVTALLRLHHVKPSLGLVLGRRALHCARGFAARQRRTRLNREVERPPLPPPLLRLLVIALFVSMQRKNVRWHVLYSSRAGWYRQRRVDLMALQVPYM